MQARHRVGGPCHYGREQPADPDLQADSSGAHGRNGSSARCAAPEADAQLNR